VIGAVGISEEEISVEETSNAPLGGYGDRPIGAIRLAMNKLGVPISPVVRGPALPIREEAHERVESVLREAGLLTVREVG
jgi:dihydrodipicolinate synthase/N-acetylneuraminate lyase